jgi:hypothetical protein
LVDLGLGKRCQRIVWNKDCRGSILSAISVSRAGLPIPISIYC